MMPSRKRGARPLRAARFSARWRSWDWPAWRPPGAMAADGWPRPRARAHPTGTTIVRGCTPTGPELCFNAIDDNCNGVIDEGCGELTGVLQVAIAWASSPADVNLALVTPAPERVLQGTYARDASSGFRRRPRLPGDDACGARTPRTCLRGLDPPRGHYVVEVTLADLRGAETPVAVRFGARLGGRVVGFDVQLAPGVDDKKTFGFDLP